MKHIPARAYVLSPQARAAAMRELDQGERLLWGGESGAFATALPKLLALVGMVIGLWIAYDFLAAALGLGVDGLFGANRSRTPKGVAIVMLLVAGAAAAFILRATLASALALKRSGRKVTLLTDRRVIAFELAPKATSADRLVAYPYVGVRRAEAQAMGRLAQALVLTLEEKGDEGNLLRVWLPVSAGATDARDILSALLTRSEPNQTERLSAS